MSIGKILGLFGIIGAILMIICVFLAWGSCEITALGVTAKFDFSGWCLATGGDVTVTALGESETASISELGLKYAFAPYVVLACGIIGIIAAALPMFMDCNENVNKGLGIRNLAELLGCSTDDAIACGDAANDTTMLEAAGVGVAVANAIDGLAGVADYVAASTCDDGVLAEVLRELILPPGRPREVAPAPHDGLAN